MEEIAVGFCRVSPADYERFSFRQLNYVIEAEIIRREDAWDHVRHIMAPWCGGDPKKLMKLRRDKLEVSPEQVEKMKQTLERFKQMDW